MSCFRPIIEMSIPSSLDPTLAPKGCHVVSLFTQYTPYDLKYSQEGWTKEMKKEYTNLGKGRPPSLPLLLLMMIVTNDTNYV